MFMVRIAQGLVHMGKGTMTLNPFHSDNQVRSSKKNTSIGFSNPDFFLQLMSPVAVAGILSCILSFLDVKQTILGKSHYLLYCLAPAIHPRMLVSAKRPRPFIRFPR